MSTNIRFEISSGKRLALWGLRDMTQQPEVIPPIPRSVPTRQQKQTSALLKMPVTPYQERQQTQSLVAEIGSILFQIQELGVSLNNPGEIREYLLQFPDLIEVVPLAVKAVLDHLPSAHLVLEVYRDPEIEDQDLTLYVRAYKYDDDFFERMEAAERQYLNLLTGKKGWLQLTTDFRKPELE